MHIFDGKYKKVKELGFLLFLSLVWFLIGWLGRGRLQKTELALMNEVYEGLRQNYYGELPDSRDMSYAAVRGMVDSLQDPHAAFLEPVFAERYVADVEGQTGIVGMLPEFENGRWLAGVVMPGEPAALAGLQEGDLILSVDGIPFTDETTALEASLLLRGPVGQPAVIQVQRGDKVLELRPVRKERITVSPGEMIADGIGYFAQYTFTDNAPDDVAQTLQSLMAQNPQVIIWDLRSNGGGSMDAAQTILSQFIGEGLLFKAQLRDNQERTYMASGDGLATAVPLLVLIGERTYSAAETVASSIADHERGVLIGGVTHGKGSIQTAVPLVDGSRLQFTIAHWLSPHGADYDGRGVPPDLTVEDDPQTAEDDVLQFAVQYAQENLLP